MTLSELCEPLFHYLCRLNRSARQGATADLDSVRAQVKGLFASMKQTAAADFKLNEQYNKIEIALKFFVDSIISESRLGIAQAWHKSRLAYEWNELAGDEKFFDLLEETLKEPTEEATERLVVYYTCLGLGFTGWYAGKPDYLKRKMAQIAERIRKHIDADVKARICQEAYDHTDTRNLIAPPARKLIGIVIAILGMTLVLFITNLYMYRQASADLAKALGTIIKHAPAVEPAGGPAPKSSSEKEDRP